MYTLPSTLSKKSCSFGYGDRLAPMNKTGRDSPPPTAYNTRTIYNMDRRLKSHFSSFCKFGIRGMLTEPYDPFLNIDYKTNSIIPRDDDSPGPGTYDIKKVTVYDKHKGFTLKGKRKPILLDVIFRPKFWTFSKALPITEVRDTRAWVIQTDIQDY